VNASQNISKSFQLKTKLSSCVAHTLLLSIWSLSLFRSYHTHSHIDLVLVGFDGRNTAGLCGCEASACLCLQPCSVYGKQCASVLCRTCPQVVVKWTQLPLAPSLHSCCSYVTFPCPGTLLLFPYSLTQPTCFRVHSHVCVHVTCVRIACAVANTFPSPP